MAPSAENNNHMVYNGPSAAQESRKNVTFAVNYEPSMVDRFWQSSVKESRNVESPTNSTTDDEEYLDSRINSSCFTTTPSVSLSPSVSTESDYTSSSTASPSHSHMRNGNNSENSAPNALPNELEKQEMSNNRSRATKSADLVSATTTSTRASKRVSIQTPPKAAISMEQERRRSNREQKKREAPLVSTRVRYDMELVPYVRRQKEFVKAFASWPLKEKLQRRTSSRLTTSSEDATSSSSACPKCDDSSFPSPFQDGESVVWIPAKRSEWDDSVSEMTAVCTSAALRKHTGDKPFVGPLSPVYIRDRIDIDDPLRGYQIRHKTGGWLQGFILWTNFTTWTHFFHWDSLLPVSGMATPVNVNAHDIDGSLAKKLESEPRSGDPLDSGIVFDSIAEIGLLGGLGCGEYLLRMALDSIRKYKQYKFVVLQATDSSRTFYERFGFRRVGAICRYGTRDKTVNILPTLDSPVQGYRHWTHANESAKSLNLHGGPSYMMVLELCNADIDSSNSSNNNCASCESSPSFLEEMMKLKVEEKPTIEQLGAASTPAPRKRRRSTLGSPKPQYSVNTPKPQLASAVASQTAFKPGDATPLPVKAGRPKRVYDAEDEVATEFPHSDKRRKLLEPSPLSHLLTPPPGGLPLSYNQKQYQSVWLAVPPQEKAVARRAPRNRDSVESLETAGATFETPTETSLNLHKSQFTTASTMTSTQGSIVNHKLTSKRISSSGMKKKVKPNTTKATLSPKTIKRTEKVSTPIPCHLLKMDKGGKKVVNPIDKKTLVKQKVKSYPRDRIHFFNKVVKLKTKKDKKYFFVLNYNESKGTLRIVPMEPRGVLSGKREGHARYQCKIETTDRNFRTVRAMDFEAVPAFMVMKTPNVAQEAWDIEA
jgi:hypothetical protein